MLKKIFSFFKNPDNVYLTPKMKKQKKKLKIQAYLLYTLYSLLFLGQILLTLGYKFQLFSKENETKLSGWILLIMIFVIYFSGKKIVKKIKEHAESTTSIWIDQLYTIVPLILLVGFVAFIYYQVASVLYVLSHILVARIIWSPVHAGYLSASRRLDVFNRNIDSYKEKKSQDDFAKDFGLK